MKALERFSIGTGDRFGREGVAQLEAFKKARAAGTEVAIVWNKSNREHLIIGTGPAEQRAAADAAIKATGWDGQYLVDADHVGLATVDRFIPHCDFFTIDVADFIGKPVADDVVEAFAAKRGTLLAGKGLPSPVGPEALKAAAKRYLGAVKEAGKVYRHIREGRGTAPFVVEVSMDETEEPQSPAELAVILAALADEGVPVNTVAPKFSGRFNKGVDYVGDVGAFMREFEADVDVALWAPAALGLPPGFKLSVHSGSDKFSLYRGIGEIVRKKKAGLHLKTAGTTWLEELVGLAEAGGDGLALAKEVYRSAHGRYDELVGPYAAVVDIDRAKLPSPTTVESWNGKELAAAIRHVRSEPRYDQGLRQLLHVGYKVAAEMGARYLDALETHRGPVSHNVTVNLWERHLKPLLGL
jgi:hypothetical protein